MNKIIILCVAVLMVSLTSHAQSKRYAFFEHFTQASCGPCAVQNPDFEAVVAENEGKYHHIAYHTSWPGFDPMHDVNPADVQDRVDYYGVTGVPAMQLLGSDWTGGPAGVTTSQIESAAAVGAPVRINVEMIDNMDGSYNAVITVVETGLVTGSDLRLRAAVVERVIDYDTPPGSNGELTFPNVFRLMPTTTAGLEYAPTGVGTEQTSDVPFVADAAWNTDDIYVVAWLQDDADQHVINSGSSDDPSWEVATISSTLAGGADPISFEANLYTGGVDEEIQVSFSSDQPADWAASIVVDGVSYATPTVDFILTGEETVVGLDVGPGLTAAIANYTLEVTSLTYPDDPISSITYTVVSGITDLIVDHGGEATQWNDDYAAGLDLAGNVSYGLLPIDKFITGMQEAQLSEVLNVYDNVSWTFPSFTEAETAVLATFLDGGGNLLVNGQDLGWDTYENEGTAVTQAFYTDYLSAEFNADGSGANSQLTWSGDIVFDGLDDTGISDVYGGNIYPDEITPIDPATAIFNYNGNAAKVGGLRVIEDDHKVVYFGVDLGMIDDADVRHQLIQTSHDWFVGLISGLEYDLLIKNVLGQNYPNPAVYSTIIPMDALETTAYITVIDMQGRTVSADMLQQGLTQYELDVTAMNAGIYQYYLVTPEGRSEAISFEVFK